MIKKEDITFYQRQKESTPEEIILTADLHWQFHQVIPMYYVDQKYYMDQERAIEVTKHIALNDLRSKLYGDVIKLVRELYGEFRRLPRAEVWSQEYTECHGKITALLRELMNTGKEITE
jgi:hypothetical protein